MEEAIKKINTEMQKDPNNTYMEIIGHYLIDRATVEPMVASAINEPKKTLKGAMDKVVETAKQKKQGGVAVLMPQQVFDVIDDYFGLTRNVAAMYKSLGVDMATVGTAPIVSYATETADLPRPIVLQGGKRKQKSRVDIDLDDFL